MKNIIWKLSHLYTHLQDGYMNWKESIWDRDPEERYCCDGHMCACGGASVRETWDFYKNHKDYVNAD